MKMSRRAMRMARSHGKGEVTVNLVPMIDLLTVLVFFLLVSSADVATNPTTKSLKLPTSTANVPPKFTPNVQVSAQVIVVEGRPIARVEDAMATQSSIIPELVKEMEFQYQKTEAANSENPAKGEVTVLADQNISYALVKKIMISCLQAGYSKVSLAVNTSVPKD